MIPEGLTTTLVATGTYSDGTTADVTGTVSWTSDNLLAASVSAGRPHGGRLRARRSSRRSRAAARGRRTCRSSAAAAAVARGDAPERGSRAGIVAAARGLGSLHGRHGPGPHRAGASGRPMTIWIATVDPTGLVSAVGSRDDDRVGELRRAGRDRVGHGDGADTRVDRGPAGDAVAREGAHAGVHGDRALQRRDDAGPDGARDVDVVRDRLRGDVGRGGDRGRRSGTTTITASYGGKSGTATLTVGRGRRCVSIAVDPDTVLIPQGLTTTLVATGTYSDGTTADVTGDGELDVRQPARRVGVGGAPHGGRSGRGGRHGGAGRPLGTVARVRRRRGGRGHRDRAGERLNPEGPLGSPRRDRSLHRRHRPGPHRARPLVVRGRSDRDRGSHRPRQRRGSRDDDRVGELRRAGRDRVGRR